MNYFLNTPELLESRTFLRAVCGNLPVLGSGDNEGKLRMEGNAAQVLSVSLQGLHAGFGLVVPDLHEAVVSTGHLRRMETRIGPMRSVVRCFLVVTGGILVT